MPTILQLIQNDQLQASYALVYMPNKKRNRKRIATNCVFKKDSEQAAKQEAQPDKNLYPAIVCGPSRSSEGVILYYLIQWLD
ncbi:MAG: hypothetical protein KAH84_07030 [Thiomargarita sp.]|nr:hypothetical protein [Thiomargarita sp.]